MNRCLTLLLATMICPDAFAADLNKKLIKASKKADCDRIQELLAEGADPNAVEDGAPALVWILRRAKDYKRLDAAAYKTAHEAVRCVQLLLEKGAVGKPTGHAPLVTAVGELLLKESTPLILGLLEKSDNADWGWAFNMYRLDPYRSGEIMREAMVDRCLEIYEEGKNCMGALGAAGGLGLTDRVQGLLEKGAAADAADPDDVTPLMRAAQGGHEDIVKLLLAKGARSDHNAAKTIGSKTFHFGTPLAYAALGGHRTIAKLLMEKGAPLDPALEFLSHETKAGSKRAAEAIALLQGLELKTAAGGGVSREELASIVKSAVAQAQERPAAASVRSSPVSDVDKPAYRLAERPDDFAVVVGIEEYSELPPAQFAARDAEAVKNHLLALGLPSRNIVHLAGEKAGYKALEKFIETWLPRNVTAKSRLFFYFSGHGAPDPTTGEAYLLPWDGDPAFLENTGYPLRRLYEKLGALKSKETLIALDSCFSGAGGRSLLAKGARPLVTKVATAPISSDNLVVLAAAGPDQITSTREDQGHGAFTYHLLKGLSGGAKDAVGAVTAQSLFDYLKPKVQDDARRQNREQTPALQGTRARLELAHFR